jgi:hypothetical protein
MTALQVTPLCLKFICHGGVSYWASPSQAPREVFWRGLARREQNARARNVECRDPACWCRQITARASPPVEIVPGHQAARFVSERQEKQGLK